MFEKLSEVPKPIADFYHEEVRTEKVVDKDGNDVLKEVPYIGIDDDGEEVELTRFEQTFHDVTYLVSNERGQTASVDEVMRVAEKHKGNRDDVLDTFIGFHLNGVQWAFYDDYMAWLGREPAQEDYIVYSEETTETVYDQDAFNVGHKAWQGEEPKKPTKQKLTTFKKHHYCKLRKFAYASSGEQNDMRFHDATEGTETWIEHVKSVKEQYPK